MAASRFIDWLTNLTAKSTTIDGTEITHIGSSGLSQKATLKNILSYGFGAQPDANGAPQRVGTDAGYATVFRTENGAIYLEKGPYTGGQVQGNARGAGAFDWQAVRGNAANVASGVNAVAIGNNCTASGVSAIALGVSASASGYASVALGGNATASGTRSFAAGGFYLLATNNSQVAIAGYAPAPGQAQANIQTFYTATTDASATVLNITGTATDRMVIPATRSCAFIGIVQAMCNVSSTSNFIKAWKIEGVITRDGNNTTRIVGTPTITEIAKDADGTPTPSTWAIASITADDTNEALAINVTGQAGTTIRWQATLMYSQVGF